jgi:hypothetical protein
MKSTISSQANATLDKKRVKISDNNLAHVKTGDFNADPGPAYVPLSRQDFNMGIIDNWCEIRGHQAPKRRAFHSSFIAKDYLYIYGGIDINEGKLDDFIKIHLLSDNPAWETIKYKGVTPGILIFFNI